jgi:hypothetical protein
MVSCNVYGRPPFPVKSIMNHAGCGDHQNPPAAKCARQRWKSREKKSVLLFAQNRSHDLLNLDELGLEDESRVGGDDTADSTAAIGKIGGNSELALLAHLHAEEALIPALDDLAITDSELERVTAVVAGVELLAVGESAPVVDCDGVTALGLGSLALAGDLNLESWKLGDGHFCCVMKLKSWW